MSFVRVRVGSVECDAELLSDGAPETTRALQAALPISVGLVQEQWSGAFVTSVHPILPLGMRPGDPSQAYQAPGELYVDADSGALAICYGPGRLQNAVRPLRAIPVARVIGDTAQLTEICRAVQFKGLTPMLISSVERATATVEDAASKADIHLVIGSAHARAALLDADRPGLCASFLEKLPLSGLATNTHSSGPLIRFWNKLGGDEGETPLAPTDAEMRSAQTVLYPGYLYYLPKAGVSGLRLPFREPTVMRNAISGRILQLLPIAKILGDWSALRDEASRARLDGALPMQISRLS